MSVFTTGEAARLHDATPEPDDAAVAAWATDEAPGSSLGRVLRVAASRNQVSVQLPAAPDGTPGRVVQAYRTRFGWTLADGTRRSVRWAARATPAPPAVDPHPAVLLAAVSDDAPPAPVSRETAPGDRAPVEGDDASGSCLDGSWRVATVSSSGTACVLVGPGGHDTRVAELGVDGSWRDTRTRTRVWFAPPAPAAVSRETELTPAESDAVVGFFAWLRDEPGPTADELRALEAELAAAPPELHQLTEHEGLASWHVACSCGWRSRGATRRALVLAWNEATGHALSALRDAVRRAG